MSLFYLGWGGGGGFVGMLGDSSKTQLIANNLTLYKFKISVSFPVSLAIKCQSKEDYI